MSAWIWFIRKFGLRLAYLYWREGRDRGWMSEEQAAELFIGIAAAEQGQRDRVGGSSA